MHVIKSLGESMNGKLQHNKLLKGNAWKLECIGWFNGARKRRTTAKTLQEQNKDIRKYIGDVIECGAK